MKTTEHTMASWDGAKLFYRAWWPDTPATRALLLFHRGHEHSARWQETVESLDLEDVSVFAWDARGHGRSDGERGAAPNVSVLIRDAESFAQQVSAEHGIAADNTVVMAHSVGAVVAAAWVHDFAPPIRGLVLGAPAFRVKLYVPLAVPLMRLWQRLFGPGYSEKLREGQDAHARRGGRAAVSRRPPDLPSDRREHPAGPSRHLHAPGQGRRCHHCSYARPGGRVRLGGEERDPAPIRRAPVVNGEGTARPAGFHHAIFHEQDRQRVFAKARDFILICFNDPPPRPSLLDADQRGYTKQEFEKLKAPGGLRPRGWR